MKRIPSCFALLIPALLAMTGCLGKEPDSNPINSISTPSITTMTLPDGSKDVFYNQVIEKEGGGMPYSWAIIDGALPGGLEQEEIGSNLRIFGTPTVTGEFTFTVELTGQEIITTVVNQLGDTEESSGPTTDEEEFTIRIAEPLVITTDSLLSAKRDESSSRPPAGTAREAGSGRRATTRG